MNKKSLSRIEIADALTEHLKLKGIKVYKISGLPKNITYLIDDSLAGILIPDDMLVRTYPFHFRVLFSHDIEKIKQIIAQAYLTYKSPESLLIALRFGIAGEEKISVQKICEKFKHESPAETKRKIDTVLKQIRNIVQKKYVPSILDYDAKALKLLTGQEIRFVDRSSAGFNGRYSQGRNEKFRSQWKELKSYASRKELVQQLFLR